MKRRAIVILKGLALALVAAVVVGVAYEQLAEWRDRKRFPQIGRSVDLGGRTLNIYCSGEGSPSVILEPLPHTAGYGWVDVQPQIAKFTRACWYDRAGHGWSDPGPPPRTSAAIASDLHGLLGGAAVPPPYVLVGCGWGGFHVRVFAGKYPGEVAGMVLVGPAQEDELDRIPDSLKNPFDRLPPRIRSLAFALVPTVSRIGLFRLIDHFVPLYYMPPAVPVEQRALLHALYLQTKFLAATASEQENYRESGAEARAAGSLGDRPLIVLIAGQGYSPPDPAAARDDAAWQEVVIHELLPQLARLSRRGHQVNVENSGYFMPYEAPDAVVGAIREVVEEVRAEQPK